MSCLSFVGFVVLRALRVEPLPFNSVSSLMRRVDVVIGRRYQASPSDVTQVPDGAVRPVQLARAYGKFTPRVVLFGPGPSIRAITESTPRLR